MLRGDNVIAGTTTTLTGTLTLAAVPEPPGGLDFDTWLRTAGLASAAGFGSSTSVPISYTIIEYSDTTFSKAIGEEKGVGLLNLGASVGIANCTLTRTLTQFSITGMNGATPVVHPGTAYSIGIAANTLVFIAPSAADVLACCPFYDSTTDSGIVYPLGGCGTSSVSLTSPRQYFFPVFFAVPMLAVRMWTYVTGTYNGGTPVSDAYGRIYLPGTDGRPGRLLADFGEFGTAGASLNSAGAVSTATLANGVLISPGFYYFNLYTSFSGGTSTPTLRNGTYIAPGNPGASSGASISYYYNTGNAVAADPASLTSLAVINNSAAFAMGLSAA